MKEKHQKKKKEGFDARWDRWWGGIPRVIKFSLLFIAYIIVAGILVWDYWCQPDRAKFIGYLIGGAFLFWQLLSASRRAAAAEKTAELTEKGNIAERYKNAIEHLVDESIYIRLAGIHALHHIAFDVEEYRVQIFEILTAYVREKTSHKNYESVNAEDWEEVKPILEIEVILMLLFTEFPPDKKIDGIYLRFEGSNLQGAYLSRFNIKLVSFSKCDLRGATLDKSKMNNVIFFEAKLQHASLINASFQYSILTGADFQHADLEFAEFKNSDLRNAKLNGAKNLTVEQLLEVKNLHGAELPDGMEEEIRRQKPELLEFPTDDFETWFMPTPK